jgi:hypothetical protein
MSVIDHKAQALSRVYAQYRDKENAVKWIQIPGAQANKIEAVYQDLRFTYDIDTANTDELDIIGRIVGVGRAFESFFQFDSSQFGRSQFGGAQFVPAVGVNDQQVKNDTYRLLIKAKIAKNNSDATLDSIIEAIKFIVSTDSVSILDNEDMSFLVSFGSLTSLELTVLNNFNIIPKPQGVKFDGYINQTVSPQFGRGQFGRSQFAYKYGV